MLPKPKCNYDDNKVLILNKKKLFHVCFDLIKKLIQSESFTFVQTPTAIVLPLLLHTHLPKARHSSYGSSKIYVATFIVTTAVNPPVIHFIFPLVFESLLTILWILLILI